MEANRAGGDKNPATESSIATDAQTDATARDNDSQQTTLACPECDSTNIRRIQGDSGVGRKPTADGPYACNDCGAHGEPVERPKQTAGNGRRGLAGQLAGADSGDLVTDGGRPDEELLDVEFVLGAGRPDARQVRLDVSSATVVDDDGGRLELSLADGEMDSYLAELGLKHTTDEFATDGFGGGDMAACDAQTHRQPAADGDQAAAALIEDVADLVYGDRDSHGDAVDQQAAAAEAWTWYLNIHGYLNEGDEKLQGSDVARMMALLKISRGGIGEYDLDHDRDGVGYAGIAGACAVREGDADEGDLTRSEGGEE